MKSSSLFVRNVMLSLMFILSLAAVAQTDAMPAVQNADYLLGQWHAKLQAGGAQYALELTVKKDPRGNVVASIESVDQAPGQAIPVSQIQFVNNEVKLQLNALSASFEGKYDQEKDSLIGVWKQGANLPLIWTRGTSLKLSNLSELDGSWRAVLQRNGNNLRLILRVTTGERGTIALLDSPDMGIAGLEVTELVRDGERITFRIPLAQVSFDGELNTQSNTLRANWLREGQAPAVVQFSRTEEGSNKAKTAGVTKQQTPLAPFAYQVREVRFQNQQAKITLAGTLTLPAGSGPFPAAVLISGSGPHDRDASVFDHKPFAVLADYLTRNGIAVLRYDDRGVAQSEGDFNSATNHDFASDVKAAIAYLASQIEINSKAIGLIGHSQGGMVGPIAGMNNRAVAFQVLMAAPATDITEWLLAKRRMEGEIQGQPEARIAANERILRRLFAVAAQPAKSTDRAEIRQQLSAVLTPELQARMGLNSAQGQAMLEELSGLWLHDVLQYKAMKTLQANHMPILALHGSLDKQVPIQENLAAIKAATRENHDVQIVALEGLNHLFQTAKNGASAEYQDLEETLSPKAMQIIRDWIQQKVKSVR
ncbi:alpha/beta hydrolase family protein [Undibacterium sp. Di24W]|uniref:alpha/beta hydrolase family protein n=1 Tax=Undibacterium sp. Di24W TaxID=3413033 RepID=UPI003BF2211F